MDYIRLYDSWPLFVQSSHPFQIESVSRWYWKQDIKSLLVKCGRTIATRQGKMSFWVFLMYEAKYRRNYYLSKKNF